MFSHDKKPDTSNTSPQIQALSDGSHSQTNHQLSVDISHTVTGDDSATNVNSANHDSDSTNHHDISTKAISDEAMVNSELAGVYQRLGITSAKHSSMPFDSAVLTPPTPTSLIPNPIKTIACNNKKGRFAMNTLDKHTSKSFDMELDETINLFLEMGNKVVDRVANAIHALTDINEILAQEVINGDQEINQMEIDLDELILLLVAKRQPAAVDLRLIMAISKGVVDLERIGDEAVKIAQMAVQVVTEGSSPRGYSEVQHLSNQVRLMTHNALEAFVHQDVEQAFDVMRNDSVINEEYQSATRSLMTYIMEDSRHVSKVINIMWVLRALERIGDHARNIAELVIYSSSGTDVRHTDFKQVEKAIQEVTEQRAARQALTDSQASKAEDDESTDK